MDIHVDIRGIFGYPFMDMLWILGPGTARLVLHRHFVCIFIAELTISKNWHGEFERKYDSPARKISPQPSQREANWES